MRDLRMKRLRNLFHNIGSLKFRLNARTGTKISPIHRRANLVASDLGPDFNICVTCRRIFLRPYGRKAEDRGNYNVYLCSACLIFGLAHRALVCSVHGHWNFLDTRGITYGVLPCVGLFPRLPQKRGIGSCQHLVADIFIEFSAGWTFNTSHSRAFAGRENKTSRPSYQKRFCQSGISHLVACRAACDSYIFTVA